jgi:hypothetical protein
MDGLNFLKNAGQACPYRLNFRTPLSRNTGMGKLRSLTDSQSLQQPH